MASDGVMPAETPRGYTEKLCMQSAKFVQHNADELSEHLPHPRCAWAWTEVGLSRRALGYLRHADLIEPVEGCERWWQTTEKLWWSMPRYVDDPDSGCLAGQVRFDAPPEPARSRVEADTAGGVTVDVQATLSGGSVPVREVREAREDNDEDGKEKLGMVRQARASGDREVPDDQQTLRDVVEEVAATVPTTYHPEVHPASSHPDQATLSEVSAP